MISPSFEQLKVRIQLGLPPFAFRLSVQASSFIYFLVVTQHSRSRNNSLCLEWRVGI